MVGAEVSLAMSVPRCVASLIPHRRFCNFDRIVSSVIKMQRA